MDCCFPDPLVTHQIREHAFFKVPSIKILWLLLMLGKELTTKSLSRHLYKIPCWNICIRSLVGIFLEFKEMYFSSSNSVRFLVSKGFSRNQGYQDTAFTVEASIPFCSLTLFQWLPRSICQERPWWEAKEKRNVSPKNACLLVEKIKLTSLKQWEAKKCKLGGTTQKYRRGSEEGEQSSLQESGKASGKRQCVRLRFGGE